MTENAKPKTNHTSPVDDSEKQAVESQPEAPEIDSGNNGESDEQHTIDGEGPVEEDTPEQLREQILTAEAKAAENLDGWQRAQADYENYKRRMARDMEQARRNTAASVLMRFFPVLDDLRLALDSLPDDTNDSQWSEGIHLVHRKLVNLLEAEDITPIEAQPGQQFDPRYHEAVSQEEHHEYENGQITAVLRSGYQFSDRVLRAAQVRVAK